ncbi:MAG TPA: S41 family peptidase [Gemmatimonadaceae bacterium]
MLAITVLPAGGAAQGSGEARGDSARGPLRKPTMYEDMQMFSQVLNQIRVNHPDSVDVHELLMAAVEGMVHAADPHSYVIRAARLSPDREKAMRDGKLYPVPIDFDYVDGAPLVASVAAGSSAARLDILPGDELIAIDGRPVMAESASELALTLAGEKGSTTTLTLERRRLDGSLARVQRTVKREKVEEETAVPAAFMLDDHTGYVRVTTFVNDRVADDLHDALGALEGKGMTHLVLDLRDNGGGSVAEAARVAGEFLPKGAIVYTAEGRKKAVTDTGRVKRSFWKSEKRYPITVLVNEGTASASEMVAGALQDHDRATIVGRPTFGKSLLMEGFPLADGSVIMLVVGHVRTPCGRIIQRQYRSISRRDYYRLAGAARDTAGRPSCRTDAGRTVYGGGGIYPDVVLPKPAPAPHWLARALEDDLPAKWLPGWVSASGGALTTVEALAASPALPAAALADFRRFAASQGDTIPADSAAEQRLQRTLVLAAAWVKWGAGGYYHLRAVMDAEVRDAMRSESSPAH